VVLRCRRKASHRFIVVAAAVAVQLWSLAPMAASMIYCIGADGHSGFELVLPGERACSSCSHATADGARRIETAAEPECTDIAISAPVGVTGKASATPGVDPFVRLGLPAAAVHAGSRQRRAPDFDPPRGSATRLLRRTVLLI